MADLTVIDPYAETDGTPVNIDDEIQDHSALRSITFTSSTGSFVAGEEVTFSPSGATGLVASWDAGTQTLSYFLTPPTLSETVLAELPPALLAILQATLLQPALGDGATSTSGTGTNATDVDQGGDTWVNDGFTKLYIKNDGDQPVSVLIARVRECSDSYLHEDRFDVGAGKTDWLGPFPKVPFNDERTGLITVRYGGSQANGDVGVIPVRALPLP